MTAIASTPKGHHVQPPHGPAEPPPRTTPSELTESSEGGFAHIPMSTPVISAG